MAAPLFYAILV